MKFTVSKAEAGQRLDLFLAKKQSTLPRRQAGLTRSQIKKNIDEDLVTVNGQSSKSGYKLKFQDEITLTIPPPRKLEVLPEDIPLEIVCEDHDVIVINKPKGLVVHPAPGHSSGTLVNALLYHCKDLSGIGGVLRPGIVHRLDKDTSGLLMVAKNDFAHQHLAKQIKGRTVRRQYLALVHGEVKSDEGIIQAKMDRHPVHRKKMAVVSKNLKGREAVTSYKVIERFKGYTLLQAEIKTGRTHQIRVHMAYIGHPLVGDPVYGKKKEEFGLSGQVLHAQTLGFIHPRTGRYVEFKSEMPAEMEEIIKRLRNRLGCPESSGPQ